MKRAIAVGACVVAAGCGHFGGGNQGAAANALGGVPLSFSYSAPRTRLVLKGTITLLNCERTAERYLSSNMSVDVVASGTADPAARFKLSADALSSSSQKRDIAFELYENGTPKSLNAGSSDRSGAVIANVLEIAGTLFGIGNIFDAKFAEGDTNDGYICNNDTLLAVRQAIDLRDTIQERRDALAVYPNEAVQISKQIDALAIKLATLVQTKLTISVSTQLEIPPAPKDGGAVDETKEVRWSLGDLSQWFADDPDLDPCKPVSDAMFRDTSKDKDAKSVCDWTTDLFALTYTIKGTSEPLAKTVGKSPCIDDPEKCSKIIVIAEPVSATVAVKAITKEDVKYLPGETLATASFPVSQWGPATYLPLDVGFMESRKVGLTFDAFGRRQGFTWASEASAENATSALADIASNAETTLKAARGDSDLDEIKAENEELEARQKNAKLKACQAALDAGATECE